MEIVLLCAFALLAGLVDAVVGGGGLIQIPALFSLTPNPVPATVFGTNKLSSIAGTAVAAVNYARNTAIRWNAALPAAAAAFVFSFLGARTVSLLRPELVRPLVLVMLVAAAAYTYVRKDFGSLHAPRHEGLRERAYALLLGGAIGFYDGFFGPGTGSFLIFLFIRFFGLDFLSASAASKITNAATNVAALLYFGPKGHILYWAALPMAAANIAGSLIGTRLALRHGSAFMRPVFLAVVSALILKFAYDTVSG